MQLELFRAAAALLTMGALGLGAAQARDNVYWSVGIEAAPGVSVGVGNTRPVVVAPAPVYLAPQPIYVAPPPVYVTPQPVHYVRPAPVYFGPADYHGHKHKHKHKHKRHHGHWD